ncbi:MAG: Ribonuclease Z [Promethearchaeota archaeon]|nr:MAG: Ribonuclease Z [Candidatus Lokiarchaeota archaeon]
MKVTLIGTGGGIISENRTYPAYLINDNILIDCGEGTTQKLIKLGVINKIRVICISHLHNDHFLGIFSLLWYYWIRGRSEPIQIIGPPSTEHNIKKILELSHTPKDMGGFDIQFIELKEIYEIQELDVHPHIILKAVHVEHGFPAYAYSIMQNNSKMTYSGDTKPNQKFTLLAENSDLLICEATFPDKFEKIAHKYNHCTPSDAAEIAKKSNSKCLVLIHISPIFENLVSIMKKAAEERFGKKVLIGKDLMEINI